MKKLLIAAAILVASGAMFAGEATLGVKGTLAISANQWADKSDVKKTIDAIVQPFKDAGFEVKDERKGAMVGGGGGIFFRYNFVNMPISQGMGFSFGIQPEIGIHAGWGVDEKLSATVGEINYTNAMNFTYTTLDIPVLLNLGLNINMFKVNLAVGPNFAFVLGKPKMVFKQSFNETVGEQSSEFDVSPFLMGMQVGLGLGFNFTKNHGLIFDARGIFDFMDLKAKVEGLDEDVAITRRAGAILSLGYAYTF